MTKINLVTSSLLLIALFLVRTAQVSAQESAAPAAPGEQTPEVQFPVPEPQNTGQSLDELISALSSANATARVNAVRVLGERRERSAVPQLINLLRSDPVPEVRGWIVRSLHSIGTPEAHSAVVTAAREDPDDRVRGMAARLEGISEPPPQPFSPVIPAVRPAPNAYPIEQQAMVPQRPQRIPGRGLRVGGVVTASASYGLALLVGLALITAGDDPGDEWSEERNYVDWGWKLMLPIVGPIVAAHTNDVDAVAVIFWLWSAAEIAGVTLLAVGYARRARYLRDNPPESSRRNWGMALLPGPGGMQLSGYF